MQLLLEAGADACVSRGEDPITPLHYAAYGGYDDIVGALIAAGASVDAMDADGSTPLQFALADSGHARVAHRLLKSGASFILD